MLDVSADEPLIAPPLMLPELEPFDIEPPMLSLVVVVLVDVTEVESVDMLLSPLLHAATATKAANIAMRFMKAPPFEIMNP